MIKLIRALFRRVRSYILRKWFKVPVAGEKIVARSVVYVDKNLNVTAAHANEKPVRPMGLAMHPADQDEQGQVVVSGTITFMPEEMPDSSIYIQSPRRELLGYAAVDIHDGMSLVVEHIDEDDRVWLKPMAMEFPDNTPMSVIRATLDAGRYGVALADAAAGEPVMGYKS